MKFTLSWLKTHLDTDATLQQITDTLTRIGLELEGVEDRGAALAPFRIARVIEAVQHPNADRLRVCTVDTGGGTATRGVRGAERAHRHEGRVRAAGHLHPRHRHHAEGRRDPRRAQRGHAAVRTRDWVSATTTPASSICPRMRRSVPMYAQWAGLDDPVIDVSVTPNRGDCFSVRGIARDLAAGGIGTLKPWQPAKIAPMFRGGPRWQIDWPESCPWILGRTIRNLRNGPSPQWLQDRLIVGRPAADQHAGRYHQLLHHRPRPPAARVRRGEAHRRCADAASRPRRDIPGSERPRLHRRPPRTARSPMPPACSRWRA